MKHLFTILIFTVLVTNLFSQSPPVIEGTYFPVRNTSIKQIWDTTQGVMQVPLTGPNQFWDYSQANGQFVNICDTFSIPVLDPTTAPYHQYFPGAAFAIFVRTPLPNDAFDSLYLYFHADHQEGLSRMGGFNITPLYDSTMIINPRQFFAPPFMNYGFTRTDTSRSITHVSNYMGLKAKVRSRRIITVSYVGYGTLKLPNHTYNNVAQIRETFSSIDSIYADIGSNGNYFHVDTRTSSGKVYNFYRNNTFGSAYLMYLNVNPANTIVEQAWYTLPADIGSISGSVFTNSLETTPVTQGDVFLYRENSNFAKNDILSTTKLKPNGGFQFDSIPYGEYRIAVRPKTTIYPNASITYYGDTTNWIHASTIITTTTTSSGHKIHLQYHTAPAGTATISGQLSQDLFYSRGASVMQSNPISGIGIVIKRNPGASTARNAVTDANGEYNVSGLDNGSYTAFVDIPGMHMTGTYSFSINNNVVIQGLDYTAGKDSIHPVSSVIGVKEITTTSKGSMMKAFPNPYSASTTIQLELTTGTDVLLEVYNMLGQKITTLDKSTKQAGNYTYSFDAKSLNYSPGMYFVKLKAGNKNDVLKLIEQ